jgi:hypothetical protein
MYFPWDDPMPPDPESREPIEDIDIYNWFRVPRTAKDYDNDDGYSLFGS